MGVSRFLCVVGGGWGGVLLGFYEVLQGVPGFAGCHKCRFLLGSRMVLGFQIPLDYRFRARS